MKREVKVLEWMGCWKPWRK